MAFALGAYISSVRPPNEGADSQDLGEPSCSSTGEVYTRSDVTDYRLRGLGLSDYSVLEFFMDTYEQRIPEKGGTDQEATFLYLSDHPRSLSHRRIRRPDYHRNLPNFVGHYFPRADDPSVQEFYCASMLMLLKPWRNAEVDLKKPNETWGQAFGEWCQGITAQTRRVLDNIQFYYQAKAAAEDDDQLAAELEEMEDVIESRTGEEEMYNEDEALDLVRRAAVVPGESEALSDFGSKALAVAQNRGIFSSDGRPWMISHSLPAASLDVVAQTKRWGKQLEQQKSLKADGEISCHTVSASSPSRRPPKRPRVVRSNEMSAAIGEKRARKSAFLTGGGGIDCLALCKGLSLHELNEAQYRAFDIVAWQMEQRLNGHFPPPLRMRLTGCPGTGKSRVIDTITRAMDRWGLGHRMLRAAYTGIAASAIDGQTIHSILCAQGTHIPANITDSRRERLQELWDDKVLLVVDEDSMINKTLLSKLVRAVSVGRSPSDPNIHSIPFGDLDVIFCGDDHQFPPVAKSQAERLYHHMDLTRDTPERAEGKRVRDSFQTVVILRDQVRCFHCWPENQSEFDLDYD